MSNRNTLEIQNQIAVAIAQCLSWQSDLTIDEVTQALNAVTNTLQNPFETLKKQEQLAALVADDSFSVLLKHKIGLVYGGATKIKGYVFESADLQEVRGASALLDRINLVDLPALFHGETSGRFPQCQQAKSYCDQLRADWLHNHFPNLADALTPEMIVYSTGGNILAFCPVPLVNDLADAIEKRYTTETLTANACAVGDTFRLLEIYVGLLAEPIENTLWLDTIQKHRDNVVAQAYFGFKDSDDAETIAKAFKQRKGFSELVGKLAHQFNLRRSGYDLSNRPSRRFPPMFETHPYLMRDDSDRRSAVTQVLANQLPDAPKLSEPTARKRIIGQMTKREGFSGSWYLGRNSAFRHTMNGQQHLWKPVPTVSWVNKFEQFLIETSLVSTYDPHYKIFRTQFTAQRPVRQPSKHEARSLTEIGAASDGFVAYIYADGNNMGQYIRDQIKTPEDYQRFSQDIFEATEQSVYWALAHHIHPHPYKPDAKSSRKNTDQQVCIHPFEIITIGGDDVLLVVPANKALEVTKAIGEKFEEILSQTGRYILIPDDIREPNVCHRYKPNTAPPSKSCLSISSGVLITAANTPIYYADKLVSQLLKSAKKKAKELKNKRYFGGTVDFLTLKAVTMISSDIESFRNEGLTVRFPERKEDLKLYAAPYTLHELGGLIETLRAIKKSKFPRSQLYQIRSLLERGKRTAILNYRYFRIRLEDKNQKLLIRDFEDAWCEALTNPGNLAPWIPDLDAICKNLMILLLIEAIPTEGFIWKYKFLQTLKKCIYRTIWRELVELLPFIDEYDEGLPNTSAIQQGVTYDSTI